MAEYIRNNAEAPTEEEIKTGYAPSTITSGPFIKFLFWTFAGLAITYAITFGVITALDKVQELENERHLRLAVRQKQEFTGPRLQPSPGHDKLDFTDMEEMNAEYAKQLKGKKLWQDDPQQRNAGRPGVSEATANLARNGLRGWGK